MVSHRAVDQLNRWNSSNTIKNFEIKVAFLLGKSVWDAIMDCQGWYAELSVNHLVTRRPPRSSTVNLEIKGLSWCGSRFELIVPIKNLKIVNFTFYFHFRGMAHIDIVACQRGGVSNKPTLGSGQRQDTGSGILFKKKRNVHLIRFLLRQGEPGTSQYILALQAQVPICGWLTAVVML